MPYLFGDPESFVKADPIISPVHILPELYFLPYYGVLRAIPSKVLGVLALARCFLSLFLLPLASGYTSPFFI
jgi:quinol-cytochrome oxidoreductase complex cytochrome b subunit